jgi:hypothetical protein
MYGPAVRGALLVGQAKVARHVQRTHDAFEFRLATAAVPTANNQDRLAWIKAVVTAQQRAARPIDQRGQPTLFSGEVEGGRWQNSGAEGTIEYQNRQITDQETW